MNMAGWVAAQLSQLKMCVCYDRLVHVPIRLLSVTVAKGIVSIQHRNAALQDYLEIPAISSSEGVAKKSEYMGRLYNYMLLYYRSVIMQYVSNSLIDE